MQTMGSATPLGRTIDLWLGELAAARRSRLTLDAYRSDLRLVADCLAADLDVIAAHLEVEHLTRANLVAAFEVFSADRSPASIRRAMATVGSLCRYMVRVAGQLQLNPMETIMRPELAVRPPRVIARADYPTLLMAAVRRGEPSSRIMWPVRDEALVATYIVLGLRLSEALDIRRRDIVKDVDARTTVVLIRGKRSKQRQIVVPEALLVLWNRAIAAAEARFGPLPREASIFRHAKTGLAVSRQHVQYLFERWYRLAGIRGDVPSGALVHALRHGHATEAILAGASLVDLRDHLGHSTIAVTNQYLHSDPRRRRAVVEDHPHLKSLAAS